MDVSFFLQFSVEAEGVSSKREQRVDKGRMSQLGSRLAALPLPVGDPTCGDDG